MKNLSLLILTFVLFLGTGQASAQTETALVNPGKLKDGYAMHQGSMIQIINGQVSPLTREVTLKNGTRISKSGMVTTKGKAKQKLAEGYVVNTDGKTVLLDYDMMRYEAIQEHSQKVLGNTDAEVIVTDNGITLTGTNKAAMEEMVNRRMAIIQERNALIQQKATLLNKAKDKKAQQNSPEIKEVDAQLSKLNQEMKELEQKMRQ